MAKEKLKDEEKRSLNKESFRKLYGIFKFILPYKRRFIIGMILLIFSSFLMLAFPFLAGKLIDVASGKADWIVNDIHTITIGLIVILLIQSVISFFRVHLFAQVIERAMADVRIDLFSKSIFFPLEFYDRTRTGELISRISSDVTLLQTTFSTTLAELARQMITLVAGIIMIFLSTPSLSIFMLATFPFIIVIAMFFGKSIRKLSKSTQAELAETTTIVEEAYQAIATVKAFTNEFFEIRRYQGVMSNVVTTALKAAKYRAGFLSFIIFAIFGGMVGIIWYGAVLLQNNELTFGQLVSFVLYTSFIGGSIAGIGDMYGQVQRAIGASERIIEIQQEVSEPISDKAQTNSSNRFEGNISFNQVHFNYPSRKELAVLNGLSFELKKGGKMALVGPSGAGKSTVVQLLTGMYPCGSGSISFDGQELDSYELKHIRQNIGIVPQEVLLFGGTIRENIAYGDPSANEEEIVAAARKANALEFIESFPEGMETLVGERGIKLSGGQRQRVAIARAILKNPSILILDEATSSLDAESEHLVQQALDELMKNRTTIIIAHRLATIRKVDEIHVIENGKVSESGSHDELVSKSDGLYKKLVELQFSDNNGNI